MTPFRSRLRSSALLGRLAVLVVAALVVTAVRSRGGGQVFSFVLAGAALFAVVRLLTWLSSRVELEPGGRLVVSGPWPGRRQAVDLMTLRRASARQQVSEAGDNDSPTQVHDTLDLLDDAGAALSLRVREWARGDLLIAAVEHAAALRGVTVTGGELFGLRTATAAAPVPPPQGGPLPVLDLRLRNRLVYGILGTIFTLGGTFGTLFAALVVGGFALLLGSARPEGVPSGALLLVLIPMLFAGIGVALLSLALGARLRVGADAVLRVRTNPPWRTRSLALGDLTEATATHSGHVAATGSPTRSKVALRLADRGGRTLTIDPGAWDHPEAIARAVATAAVRTALTLDPATATYLTRGVPPNPIGPRPIPRGWRP